MSEQAKAEEEEVDRSTWGELEPSDEESSEEEEEEESDEDKPDESGFFTPADRYRRLYPTEFRSLPFCNEDVYAYKTRRLLSSLSLSLSLNSRSLSGLITPGGFSSVPAGMETPELIELRKKKIEEAMDG